MKLDPFRAGTRYRASKRKREARHTKKAPPLNIGTISTQRVKPDLDGLSQLPFTRDLSFVQRPSVFEELDRKRKNDARGCCWVGLVGLAGTGKTQLAIEQGYRWLQEDEESIVFWVTASTQAYFQQEFKQIAHILELPGHDDPQQNLLEMVTAWLKTGKYRWRIILDNADDSEAFHEHNSNERSQGNFALLRYIPQVRHGAVLVTSRNREVALKIVGDPNAIVTVPAMTEEECIQLIRINLPGSGAPSKDEEDLMNCSQKLPLAITQATSYIRHNQLMSITSYVQDFQSIERRSMLLQYNEGDLRRRRDIPNAVISTLELSFGQIMRQYPDSATLLSLMACFDSQRIPESLLIQSRSAYSRTPFIFEEIVLPLMDFSLVECEQNERTYSMHRLVWVAAEAWTNIQGRATFYHDLAFANLASTFPWPHSSEERSICKTLVPHWEYLVSRNRFERTSDRCATLRWRCAVYLMENGEFARALGYFSASYNDHVSLFGQQHKDTLSCQIGLGTSYRDLGQYEKSQQILEDALRSARSTFGPDATITITAMRLLATTYSLQGNQESAVQLLEYVYRTRSRAFGANHLETAKSAVSLSSVYGALEVRKSQKLLERSFPVLEAQCGPTHAETMKCKYNLAQTYMSLGLYSESIQLLHEYQAVQRDNFADDHPQVLDVQVTLSTAYGLSGDHAKSLSLIKVVFERLAQILGTSHPMTLRAQEHLGIQLEHMGYHERAREILEVTHYFRKNGLRAYHPDTLHTKANLALVYQSLGRSEDAMQLAQEAFDRQRTERPPGHSDILESRANIAGLHYSNKEYAMAAAHEEEIVRQRTKHYGAGHPDTIRSIANLSLSHYELGKREEAINGHQRALELAERILGPEHPDTKAYSKQLDKWIGPTTAVSPPP